MEKHPAGMPIGTMAKTAGVNVETVRFYQRKGLISRPRRVRGEIAHYSIKDVGRVKFVKAAQRLGFTLEEVHALLELEDGKHCCEVRDIAALKLLDVRERIIALQRMESALQELIAGCQTTERVGVCHLIAALQANA